MCAGLLLSGGPAAEPAGGVAHGCRQDSHRQHAAQEDAHPQHQQEPQCNFLIKKLFINSEPVFRYFFVFVLKVSLLSEKYRLDPTLNVFLTGGFFFGESDPGIKPVLLY